MNAAATHNRPELRQLSRGDRPERSPFQATQERAITPEGATFQSGTPARVTDVSEWVLEARCEMAIARVSGPLDFSAAVEHTRKARHWAYRAGVASPSGTPMPRMFDGSPTLTGAWASGQSARALTLYSRSGQRP